VELRSYKPFVGYVGWVGTQYACQTCFCPCPNFFSFAAGGQVVPNCVLVSILCIARCSSVLFCLVARWSVGYHELPYTIRLSEGPETTFRANFPILASSPSLDAVVLSSFPAAPSLPGPWCTVFHTPDVEISWAVPSPAGA
jgi:hypothetical protein